MRLVTRGDLDGLTCAVLLSLNEEVNSISLIHPQDISDGRATIRPDDIIANLPFHPGCAMWFDHHLHTATANVPPEAFRGAFAEAPSAARLVYEYYGGEAAMPQFAELVARPTASTRRTWPPTTCSIPRGTSSSASPSTAAPASAPSSATSCTWWRCCAPARRSARCWRTPRCASAASCWRARTSSFCQDLRRYSRVDGNVVVTDFRELDHTPIGNRFLVYALFPEVNVSARIHWGPNRAFPMLLLGHSIFRRTCKTNVGELAARYGGGGHRGAGSIPLMDEPDQQIQMIVRELKTNG